MLVLSRKRNETIEIIVPPSDVETKISVLTVDTRQDKVRLGIEAPRQVTVHRDEVAQAIEREKAAGAVEAA